jgi:hypothetical protein
MNIDLGSPILDIAIGLSFVFFLLAIIASALTEGVAWVLKLRAKMLREGLEGMLGDKELVKEIFQHPLIRTELVRDDNAKTVAEERGPSYIAPRNFAKAFRAKFEVEKSDDVETQLTALGIAKHGLATDDSKETEESLEKWFEDAMERVGGWYRRKSQLITVAIAVVVAIGLNASALRIVERLEKEPTVRAALVAQGEAALKETKTSEKAKEESLEHAGKAASGAYDKLGAMKVPLLWGGENVPSGVSGWVTNVLGWLLTIVAISLGAPFWFDALGKLANLRTTGKKPEPKATG